MYLIKYSNVIFLLSVLIFSSTSSYAWERTGLGQYRNLNANPKVTSLSLGVEERTTSHGLTLFIIDTYISLILAVPNHFGNEINLSKFPNYAKSIHELDPSGNLVLLGYEGENISNYLSDLHKLLGTENIPFPVEKIKSDLYTIFIKL